jgi:hypothetical protein
MNLRFGRKVCSQIFSHTFTDEYLSTKITGANPTTSIYNASVVNFYNAIGNLARFENNFFIILLKHSSLLQRWRCNCKFKGRRIGSW